MIYRMVKFFTFTLAAVAAVFLFSPSYADAQATLSVSPASGSHASGSTFTVTIVANSSQQMNAAEATLSFTTDTLSVVSTSKAGSVFTLWTEEPSHSNTQGTIRFGGGNPSGFSGNSTLLSVTFRTLGEGNARVSFSDGSVLAADGMGTNILSQMNPGNYQVTAAAAPPPPPPPAPAPAPAPQVSLPPQIRFTSETHPEPGDWYNERVVVLRWELPGGVESIRMALSRDEEAVPEDRHDATDSWTSPELEDGVWYFSARFENAAGLGQSSSYRLAIDTVPPEAFEVSVVSDPGVARPMLEFEAHDELSGIMHYEVSVDGGAPSIVSPDQMIDGAYRMSSLDRGTHTVTVVAVDMAGNETSAPDIEIEVTEETGAAVASLEEEPGFWERFGNAIMYFFLILIIALLAALNAMQKKQFTEVKVVAAKNTANLRSMVEKVFSALRDEAEDLFASSDGKPGLNEQERKLFGEMKDALDISEELVAREVDCIEKKLKE